MCRLNWDNSLYSIFHSSIDEHRLQPTHVPLTIYKVFQPVPDGILIFFDPLKNPIISIFITKHSRPRMYRKKGDQNSLQKLIIRLIKFTISRKNLQYFIIKFICNEHLEKSDFDKNLYIMIDYLRGAIYLSMQILFECVKSSFKFLSFFSILYAYNFIRKYFFYNNVTEH